jgi:hypothetical protein
VSTPTPSPSPGAPPPGYSGMTDFQNALLSKLNQGMSGGGTGGVLNDTSQIFTGFGRGLVGPEQLPKGAANTPQYQSYAQYRLDPLSWSQDQVDQFVNQGVLAHATGFSRQMGMPEVVSAWDDLIKSAYAFNSKDPNNPKWTPQDVLNTYSDNQGKFGEVQQGDWMYDIATGLKTRYVGPTTKTLTDKTVDTLTREDALAISRQTMGQMLGRMPTNDEVTKYLNLLNTYAQSHPRTTTTVSHIDPTTGEEVSRDVSTDVGMSASIAGRAAADKQALLESEMMKSPEYGAYQAATTYYNAMMQMITRGY